jgi:hypothetical protein
MAALVLRGLPLIDRHAKRFANHAAIIAYRVLAISALLSTGAAAQTPPVDPPPATVALVETFADGRTTYELVTSRVGRMWTPYFPRIEGWQQPPNTPPVKAVQFARVLVKESVRVDVSVIVGPERDEHYVETVLVQPGARVALNKLRAFGIQPIVLSLADAEPMTPYLPTVVSVSPDVEIADVTLLTAPYPGYRITVRNLSSTPASNFHVQSYRGEEKALSALRRGENGRPVLLPNGGTYTFDLTLTSGSGRNLPPGTAWSPRPLDLIEIESVRWEGGAYTGNPPFPLAEGGIEIDAGRRLQLTRIIDIYRRLLGGPDSAPQLLAELRERLDALADSDPDQLRAAQYSMGATKQAALADLARFQRSPTTLHGTSDVRKWMEYTVKRYELWVSRLKGR